MTIHAKLEQARRNLLELSTRNRLISMPRRRKRAKTVEIIDERSDDIFRILVSETQNMSFLPVPDGTDLESETEDLLLAQPLSEHPNRYTDRYLQTLLDSKMLQRRLLTIYYDARTSIEETGINILYLALGCLKWFEADSSAEERYAPLLLLPVELTRESAKERIKVNWTGEDITSNLSLLEKMRTDFGLELPPLPEQEDLAPSTYFDEIASRCAGMSRWEVLPNDIMLGFFSFAKLLMYHDLDPNHWPSPEALTEQSLINSLLGAGFASEESSVSGEEKIDERVPVETAVHVVDADSSQTVAIEEVKAGRSIVIQGPPGTGKSQTIANLIGAAVVQGRKVLFVAEKLAALEVVKRRLDAIDLGALCLELHSRKANKKTVLNELRQTLLLAPPKVPRNDSLFEKLRNVRGTLNEFCEAMHKVQSPSGMTPYRILGELVCFYGRDPQVPEFELSDAVRWTYQQHHEKRALVVELCARAKPVFPPLRHPWRGVRIDVLLPGDKQRVLNAIKGALEAIDRFLNSSGNLARLLGREQSDTIRDAEQLAAVAVQIAKAPDFDREGLANPVWSTRRPEVDDVVVTGHRFSAVFSELHSKVSDEAWFENVRPIRDTLSRYGNSLTRVFRSEYRTSVAQLRRMLRVPLPKQSAERLRILDRLIEYQEQWHALSTIADLGKAAFGKNWQDHQSNWQLLSKISTWVSEFGNLGCNADIISSLPVNLEPNQVLAIAEELQASVDPVQTALQCLTDLLRLDLALAFGSQEPGDVAMSLVRSRITSWPEQFEALPAWIAFQHQFSRAVETGLCEVAYRVYDGRLDPSTATNVFDKARLEAVLREVIAAHSVLQTFSGAAHNRKVEEFRALDLARIDYARYEVAFAHYEKIPRLSTTSGGLGIVQREMQKKRRHLPIRKLIEKAGSALQSIEPVFMMSPLSVAQFLPPGSVKFDLVIIDEASQVEPVDALGAAARADQVVVVGDDRQLPPSRFFTRLQNEEEGTENDAEDNFQASDVESILGLCLAQGMRQTMLRWHYRSRHHSLIKVSNELFYDTKLLIVPSAFSESSTAGVKFHPIADGVFDRGASRTNMVEARAVARAVMDHARRHPNLTLGVGAFSLSQKDAILAELELVRRSEGTDSEEFFNAHPHEPFFVKNLENIQGDERDIIFVSVGYGRDASGYMAMSFGPLSADGGERRLNVLITRARIRCDVFSSIIADDIDLDRGRSKGVAAFKSYLQFAQTGNVLLGTSNVRDFDSPFEEEVYRSLTQLGYDVVGQVGIAGFFVDLAVRDEKRPGRFILGIECDGVAYHSCRSARDRDRLRQQVLEDQGWFMHRIWSTDWLRAPEESLRRTVAAIENARARWAERDEDLFGGSVRSNENSASRIVRSVADGVDESLDSKVSVPYREAFVKVDMYLEPHLVAASTMANIIEQIVVQEGPVHREEISRRVTNLWGLQRAGRRIVGAVDSAVNLSLRHKRLAEDEGFLDVPKRPVRSIRNRAECPLPLRKPEMLPPSEIRHAIKTIVSIHYGMTQEEAVQQVARVFGFAATSSQLRTLVSSIIREMLNQGMIHISGDILQEPS